MRLSIAAAAVLLSLCATAWMPRVSATNRPASNCCLKVSKTRLCHKNIVDYTVQQAGLCPVDAIVFKTRRGKRVCANPERDWVKEAVAKVEARKKMKEKGEMDGMCTKGASTGKRNKKRQQRKGRRRGQDPAPKLITPQK